MVRLNIRNNCVALNNEYWGVVKNKTYFPIIPQIDNDELLKCFLIGLIDADGSVKYKYGEGAQISLVGNKKIIEWFTLSIIKLGYDGNIKVYSKPDKIRSRIAITNKKDVLKLAATLNIANCDFCFNRKWMTVKAALLNV